MDYLLSQAAIDTLNAVATRLYSEERLSGDEMRDMAARVAGVVRNAVPEHEPEDYVLEDAPIALHEPDLRLPYEAPAVLSSDDAFETLSMSCGKSNPHVCPSGSKHS